MERRPRQKNVVIYTDGACSGNPGPGGWGAILIYGEHKKEISGHNPETTNNQMEITAVLEALKTLKKPCEVSIFSDSAYLVNAFAHGWINRWRKNDWRTATKKPVANRQLWEELLKAAAPHRIQWHKVVAHGQNEYNNRCDYLARQEIKKARRLNTDSHSHD